MNDLRQADGYEGLVSANDNGEQELSLLIGGVHCAGCIQKIESSLKEQKDVHEARLNFSTGKLNVSWEGDAARANDFAAKVESLGYQVTPYNPDQEKKYGRKRKQISADVFGYCRVCYGKYYVVFRGALVNGIRSDGHGDT